MLSSPELNLECSWRLSNWNLAQESLAVVRLTVSYILLLLSYDSLCHYYCYHKTITKLLLLLLSLMVVMMVILVA